MAEDIINVCVAVWVCLVLGWLRGVLKPWVSKSGGGGIPAGRPEEGSRVSRDLTQRSQLLGSLPFC